jgi:hypothetical protein
MERAAVARVNKAIPARTALHQTFVFFSSYISDAYSLSACYCFRFLIGRHFDI